MDAFLNLFETSTEIIGGYSKDRLFKCKDEYGQFHTCRFFSLKEMKKASAQYELLKELKNVVGFQQIEYILKCQDGQHGVLVYQWVEGQSLREYLKEHPAQCFSLGQQAGQLLKQLHEVQINYEKPSVYQQRRLNKWEKQCAQYLEMGGQFDGLKQLLELFETHKKQYAINQLVQCHGDFHSGNMIINDQQEITLIDFASSHVGDISDDLNPLIFFDEIEFIKGVFDVYQPLEQTIMNTKIHLYASPRAVLWAIDYGVKEVETMIQLNQKVLDKIKALNL